MLGAGRWFDVGRTSCAGSSGRGRALKVVSSPRSSGQVWSPLSSEQPDLRRELVEERPPVSRPERISRPAFRSQRETKRLEVPLWRWPVTPVGPPPHRSRRAELPHRAPALGPGAKAHLWIWMTDSGVWQPSSAVVTGANRGACGRGVAALLSVLGQDLVLPGALSRSLRLQRSPADFNQADIQSCQQLITEALHSHQMTQVDCEHRSCLELEV